MTAPSANWYDYPEYFELAFADETTAEADFIEAACRKYCRFPVKKMLEPGCGGGRLVVELARRGYRVTGYDDNPRAIAYLQRRIDRQKLTARAAVGGMVQPVRQARTFDAAFCTFNTFRHLTTEDDALNHLQSVARSLRKGGIYILGLHLLPLWVDEDSTERWKATKGKTKVTFTLRVLSADRRQRLEDMRISMRVRSPRHDLRLRSDFQLRMYKAGQFRSLLRKANELELCDVYDFWYDIDDPLELNDEITDTVFILRKH